MFSYSEMVWSYLASLFVAASLTLLLAHLWSDR